MPDLNVTMAASLDPSQAIASIQAIEQALARLQSAGVQLPGIDSEAITASLQKATADLSAQGGVALIAKVETAEAETSLATFREAESAKDFALSPTLNLSGATAQLEAFKADAETSLQIPVQILPQGLPAATVAEEQQAIQQDIAQGLPLGTTSVATAIAQGVQSSPEAAVAQSLETNGEELLPGAAISPTQDTSLLATVTALLAKSEKSDDTNLSATDLADVAESVVRGRSGESHQGIASRSQDFSEAVLESEGISLAPPTLAEPLATRYSPQPYSVNSPPEEPGSSPLGPDFERNMEKLARPMGPQGNDEGSYGGNAVTQSDEEAGPAAPPGDFFEGANFRAIRKGMLAVEAFKAGAYTIAAGGNAIAAYTADDSLTNEGQSQLFSERIGANGQIERTENVQKMFDTKAAGFAEAGQSDIKAIPLLGGLISGIGTGINDFGSAQLNFLEGNGFTSDSTIVEREKQSISAEEKHTDLLHQQAIRRKSDDLQIDRQTESAELQIEQETESPTEFAQSEAEQKRNQLEVDLQQGKYHDRFDPKKGLTEEGRNYQAAQENLIDQNERVDIAKGINSENDATRSAVNIGAQAGEVGLRRLGDTDDADRLAKQREDADRLAKANDALSVAKASGNASNIDTAEVAVKNTQALNTQEEAAQSDQQQRARASDTSKTDITVGDTEAAAAEATMKAKGDLRAADDAAFKQSQADQLAAAEARYAAETDLAKKANIAKEIQAIQAAQPIEAAARQAQHQREDREGAEQIDADTDANFEALSGDTFGAQQKRLMARTDARARDLRREGKTEEADSVEANAESELEVGEKKENRRFSDMAATSTEDLERSRGQNLQADESQLKRETDRLREQVGADDPNRKEKLGDVDTYQANEEKLIQSKDTHRDAFAGTDAIGDWLDSFQHNINQLGVVPPAVAAAPPDGTPPANPPAPPDGAAPPGAPPSDPDGGQAPPPAGSPSATPPARPPIPQPNLFGPGANTAPGSVTTTGQQGTPRPLMTAAGNPIHRDDPTKTAMGNVIGNSDNAVSDAAKKTNAKRLVQQELDAIHSATGNWDDPSNAPARARFDAAGRKLQQLDPTMQMERDASKSLASENRPNKDMPRLPDPSSTHYTSMLDGHKMDDQPDSISQWKASRPQMPSQEQWMPMNYGQLSKHIGDDHGTGNTDHAQKQSASADKFDGVVGKLDGVVSRLEHALSGGEQFVGLEA